MNGVHIHVPAPFTDRNSIHDEINSRPKVRNSFYYSVQILSSSRFLSKNFKIKIPVYKIIILPVFLFIRMDFKEMGLNTRNCVGLAKDRDYWRALVNAVLNLQVT
jgi:hypothetical protein